MNDIAKRLLSLYKKSGCTYDELEKMTGISKSALQRYFNGETEDIPSGKLSAIAKAFNTTPTHIMGWDKENKYIEYKNSYTPGSVAEEIHIAEATLTSKVLNAAMDSGLSIRRIETVLMSAVGELKGACSLETADRYRDKKFTYKGTEIIIAGKQCDCSPADS